MYVAMINTPSTTVESIRLLQHLLMYFHNISSWLFFLFQLMRTFKHFKNFFAPTCFDNDIQPHTVQEHNERTSTEFNLVTA